MNPNDPATMAYFIGSLVVGVVTAYGACFGVVALVDHFKRVAR